jgi:hypothetical protein
MRPGHALIDSSVDGIIPHTVQSHSIMGPGAILQRTQEKPMNLKKNMQGQLSKPFIDASDNRYQRVLFTSQFALKVE